MHTQHVLRNCDEISIVCFLSLSLCTSLLFVRSLLVCIFECLPSKQMDMCAHSFSVYYNHFWISWTHFDLLDFIHWTFICVCAHFSMPFNTCQQSHFPMMMMLMIFCCCCCCLASFSFMCIWHKRRFKVIHYYNKNKPRRRRTQIKESKAKKKGRRRKRSEKQKHNVQEQIVAKTKLNSCWLNLENIFRQRALVFFLWQNLVGTHTHTHKLTYTHTDTPVERKKSRKNVSEWLVCLSFAFLFWFLI